MTAGLYLVGDGYFNVSNDRKPNNGSVGMLYPFPRARLRRP
jgi:hypothetical protein